MQTTNTNEKIVLAYSGGLDTTAIIPWLKENYPGCQVIACCVDVGQVDDYAALEKKAYKTGADKAYIIDVRDEFARDFVMPMVKAGAIYEDAYLLGTAAARPLIAKKLVDVALDADAQSICHGATGKGNDQLRFELSIKAFAPQMKIIAPWRIWSIKSREDAMEYLRERGIEIPMKKDQSYSRDENLWHLSHEGLELEDPACEPNYSHLLQLSVAPEAAPDQAEYVELEFDKGVPTQLMGVEYGPAALIEKLNEIGGRHGIGIADMVENRIIGLKSRGIYETPGGSIIYAAHRALEGLCLDRQTLSFKSVVATRLAEVIYAGEWYTPLREALSAFVDVTQDVVCGRVRLKLYKGNISPAGITSPYSLYNQDLSSFTTGEMFDHKDAEGFINLAGLTMKVRGGMQKPC